MPELPGAGRLDAETLAAYIDGLLPPEERARVEAEIAADPESYEWVVNSINAVDDAAIVAAAEPQRAAAFAPTPSPAAVPKTLPGGGSEVGDKVLPFYRRRAVQGVFGAMVAVAAALVIVVRTQPVWWQDVWGPAVDPRFAKLVEAVGEERYVEARLAGRFKYGPLRQVTRGADVTATSNASLLSIAAELEEDVQARATPERLHALGVAELLVGGDHIDAAVDYLTSAAAARDNDAVSSDLAATLLARYSRSGRNEDAAAALGHSDAALRRSPKLAAARFNRALALTFLRRDTEAIDAWKDYVSAHPGNPWEAEARQRLERVELGAR